MDRDHVWGHLVFGPVTSIKTGDEAFMQACYAAYNDWLYEDFCSAAPDRLIGVAMLPPYPEAAFAELKSRGLGREEADYRTDDHGEKSYRVFFVVAPDGLCYCLGQRQKAEET